LPRIETDIRPASSAVFAIATRAVERSARQCANFLLRAEGFSPLVAPRAPLHCTRSVSPLREVASPGDNRFQEWGDHA
jgi:hypothetical protein